MTGIFENSILVQMIPTIYEKQMMDMSTSGGTGFDQQLHSEPAGILNSGERAFSEHKRLNYKKKNLARIEETANKQHHSVVKKHIYFKSPERNSVSKDKEVRKGGGHRQCKCEKRQEIFRLKQKVKPKITDSKMNHTLRHGLVGHFD